MTQIIGQINDSGGRPLDCSIEVLLPGGTIDRLENPPAWNLAVPAIYECPSGAVNFELTPTWNQTYKFRIFTTTITERWRSAQGAVYTGLKFFDEVTGVWYGGIEGDPNPEPLIYEPITNTTDVVPAFFAQIPSRGFVNIADLQPSGITPTNLDTSILAIADILVTRPEYLAQLRSAIDSAP